MLIKKRHIIYTSFGIILCLSWLLPYCKTSSTGLPSYHSFLMDPSFQNADRMAKITHCSGCHADIVANEMQGPHLNGFSRLIEHQAYVNSDLYHDAFYTKRVNTVLEDCMGCHASENLYETLLKTFHNDPAAETHQIIERPLLKARVENTRMTGTDCFTCHFNGHDFLSLKTPQIPESSRNATQDLHTIAMNNMNCYPCHFDILAEIAPHVAVQSVGAFLCNHCHVETNPDGKPSHYYFWNKDPDHKQNPLYEQVMNDFQWLLQDGNQEIVLVWNNQSMPHTLPIATEILFELAFLNVSGMILSKEMIRVNRKQDYDREMFRELGGQCLEGTVGRSFPVNQPVEIRLNKPTQARFVEVTYYRKAQFWLPDDTGVFMRKKRWDLAENRDI